VQWDVLPKDCIFLYDKNNIYEHGFAKLRIGAVDKTAQITIDFKARNERN